MATMATAISNTIVQNRIIRPRMLSHIMTTMVAMLNQFKISSKMETDIIMGRISPFSMSARREADRYNKGYYNTDDSNQYQHGRVYQEDGEHVQYQDHYYGHHYYKQWRPIAGQHASVPRGKRRAESNQGSYTFSDFTIR